MNAQNEIKVAIIYPDLVPDFIRRIKFGKYNTDIIEFLTGAEWKLPTQQYAVGATLRLEYKNRKLQDLSDLMTFAREVRGGRSFVLPEVVYRHDGFLYQALLILTEQSHFILNEAIEFEETRSNTFNFTVPIESVLTTKAEPAILSFDETFKFIYRIPQADGTMGAPQTYTYTNTDSFATVFYRPFDDGGTLKYLVSSVKNGQDTPLAEFVSLNPFLYPVVEVRRTA